MDDTDLNNKSSEHNDDVSYDCNPYKNEENIEQAVVDHDVNNANKNMDNDGNDHGGSIDNDTDSSNDALFLSMINHPIPFLVAIPILFIILIGLGWSKTDIVETKVYNLWVPSDGDFSNDVNYLADLGLDEFPGTTFVAMARNFDGTESNLFTPTKLQQIRLRMEETESTTVTYKGVTFTWDDFCMDNSISLDTNYKFPCIRLSPMDFFQESDWFFDDIDKVTWYQDIIRKSLIEPLVKRVGILQQVCTTPTSSSSSLSIGTSSSTAATTTSTSSFVVDNEQQAEEMPCDYQVKLRSDRFFAMEHGYSRDYATPMGLLSDVISLPMSDKCRICVENELDNTIERLHKELILNFFKFLTFELNRMKIVFNNNYDDIMDQDELEQVQSKIQDMINKASTLSTTISKKDVEDFFMYYVIRGIYAEMGAEAYYELYNELINSELSFLCTNPAISCPPKEITMEDAKYALYRHADNAFSNISTAGAPFPIWSKPDGSGYLFEDKDGEFHPVSGSGINMNASLFSIVDYFDLLNVFTPAWSPMYNPNTATAKNSNTVPSVLLNDELWVSMVERNPIFAWFMGSLEPMTSSCNNENLKGTNTGIVFIDEISNAGTADFSRKWCTEYNIPYKNPETYTKQHFAKMWYDLLLASESFLNITEGISNPYTWTIGVGCGYTLGGTRFSYTGQNETTILEAASNELYYIDEGVIAGVIDRNLLLGGKYTYNKKYKKNELQSVNVIQAIYPALTSKDIIKRISNCNRPGGPITNITQDDAKEILYMFKESFENTWIKGYDDDTTSNGVQFVGYFDDYDVIGTTGRFLTEVTLSNGKLTAISIIVIAVFSILILYNTNPIESRVLITIVGVILVILGYFAALGLSLLLGIKLNITISWTLPFIILGVGVDDMYIVLMSLNKQRDYSKKSFLRAMKEVIVPVTITSLVNASMFAIMNISNIPAVTKTAQVASIAIIFLYVAIIFCFPAFCYLDMRRQASNKYDLVCCLTRNNDDSFGDDVNSSCNEKNDNEQNRTKVNKIISNDSNRGKCFGTYISNIMYSKCFRPLLAGTGSLHVLMRIISWLIAIAMFSSGIYGITQRRIGLGLEDFFPTNHQAGIWATVRTEELASWPIGINWGALDYSDPDVQMRVIKQFEDVVSTSHVSEIDTKQLWLSQLALWTTRQCDANVVRADPDIYECGRDQVYSSSFDSTDEFTNTSASLCSGTWKLNSYKLRVKEFPGPSDTCQAFEGGICLPTSNMHIDDLIDLGVVPNNNTNPSETEHANSVWCPVFEGWSDDKMQFCMQRWRNLTGGSGNLVLEDEYGTQTECSGVHYNDETVRVPLVYSVGPNMFALDLFSHEDTVDLIEETRRVCDDDPDLHCWMTGIPYNFWSQYLEVFDLLIEVGGVSVAVAFAVSFLLLFSKLHFDGHHSTTKVIGSSVIGALLIAVTNLFSIVSVSGLSILAKVNLTGFSVMTFCLSVAFSVEYAVHVVSRWLRTDMDIISSVDRVDHTMSFLILPTFMSFISSLIGVVCLAFTEFNFNRVFFFRPLIIMMPVTYFYGCVLLPLALTYLDFDFVKVGKFREIGSVSSPLSSSSNAKS